MLWKEKLMYVMQLKRLEEKSLALEIYKEQMKHGWPGLAQEVAEICKKLGLKDLNTTEISKEKVSEEIFYHHYKKIKEDIAKMTKVEDIKHENFREVQAYMKLCSIEKARLNSASEVKCTTVEIIIMANMMRTIGPVLPV